MTHGGRNCGRVVAALMVGSALVAGTAGAPARAAETPCDQNTGITLSPGFCATVFADNLGHVRHMVVAPDGVLYANTWSGRYYHNVPPPFGGFLIALRDSNGDGHAEVIQRFGPDRVHGAAGGTGIGLYNGALYAELNDRIVRYKLPSGTLVPSGNADTIVSDLPLTGDHPMHPFVIDARGNLFVDLGSATNSCQRENRIPSSAGHQPCTELETRAGIWRYDANKTGQAFSPKERYVTGLRNGEGLSFDSAGRLFATMHGRDQLSQNWPRLYSVQEGAEEPAEELVELHQGADYGWPECYFDAAQKKLVLAPEYGGDGGKTVGVCANKQAPVAFFPAHWAPNDLLIYTGTAFPKPYQGGAFIAFHGSWNRAPEAQGGYNVVFQPLADGRAAGAFIVFADGFAGETKEPGGAAFRPSGLAMGPAGALFISDDVHGRIWRVTYKGGTNVAGIAPAPPPAVAAAAGAGSVQPPEGVHPGAGRAEDLASLPAPPGASKQDIELGDRIFHGEAASGTCSGCHGSNGKGSPVGPDLTSGQWLWGNGSLQSIEETIKNGVPHPKRYTGAMPPNGGAPLSQQDLAAVSKYVWALGHAGNGGAQQGK